MINRVKIKTQIKVPVAGEEQKFEVEASLLELWTLEEMLL
jgi:hypothetical protein